MKVAANADKESLKPRFFIQAHLESLFSDRSVELAESPEQERVSEEKTSSDEPNLLSAPIVDA